MAHIPIISQSNIPIIHMIYLIDIHWSNGIFPLLSQQHRRRRPGPISASDRFFSEIGGENSHKKKDMEKHGTCVVFISRDMCHLFEL